MNLLYFNDCLGEYLFSFYVVMWVDFVLFVVLVGDVWVDVVVVGGGYIGLFVVLYLVEVGCDVVLLEVYCVGFGVFGWNGGQLGLGQWLEVDDLEVIVGCDVVWCLWDMVEEVKVLICDLVVWVGVLVVDGIVYVFCKFVEFDYVWWMIDKLVCDYGYDCIVVLDRVEFWVFLFLEVYVVGELDMGVGYLYLLNLVFGMVWLVDVVGVCIYELLEVIGIWYGDVVGKIVVSIVQGWVICDQLILVVNGYLGDLELKVMVCVMLINNFIVVIEFLGVCCVQVLICDIGVYDMKFVVNYWCVDFEG